MCYYRRFLYTVCGHAALGSKVALCSQASKTQKPCPDFECHPLHSLVLHDLCLRCRRERARLVSALEALERRGANIDYLHQRNLVGSSRPRTSLGDLRLGMKERLAHEELDKWRWPAHQEDPEDQELQQVPRQATLNLSRTGPELLPATTSRHRHHRTRTILSSLTISTLSPFTGYSIPQIPPDSTS